MKNQSPLKPEDREFAQRFCENLSQNMKPLDPDFAKVFNDRFWDLLLDQQPPSKVEPPPLELWQIIVTIIGGLLLMWVVAGLIVYWCRDDQKNIIERSSF